MRILTVRQPWAWAIVHGGKDVENRVRNIAGDYRGPVAIHAGVAWDWDSQLPVGETPHPTSVSLRRGAIIGIVDLVEVHHVTTSSVPGRVGAPVCWDTATPPGHLCSKWAESFNDGWHLEVANARPLREPFPFKGALGLRRLDDETVARVLEAIV